MNYVRNLLFLVAAFVSVSAAAAEGAEARAKPAAPFPPGDIVTLKNGRELRGFQVLKETPDAYVINVLEGGITLSIPRRQVASITYDDIDAAVADQPGSTEEHPEPEWIPARHVPTEAAGKLTKELGQEFLAGYEGVLLSELLQAAAAQVGLSLTWKADSDPNAGRVRWEKQGTGPVSLLQLLLRHVTRENGLSWRMQGENITILQAEPIREKETQDAP